MFLNADSLTNKMAELNLLANDFNPHIIGVNEVLPKYYTRQIHPEEFGMEGYEMIVHPNVEQNTGRGSIMYIHKSIKYKQINMKIENKEFQEAIFAEIALNSLDLHK